MASSRRHPLIAQNLRAYAGLLLYTVCVYGIMYSPQSLLNTISTEFGSGMASTGMLIGVFMLSLAVSPLFVGVLLNKTGIRRAIIASAALLSVSSALLYFTPSFAWLMTVRLLQALFIPISLTAIMASISSLFRLLDLSRAMAGYIACNLLGSLSARILCGWMASYTGWRITLASFCVSGLISLVIIAFSLRESAHHHRRVRPSDYIPLFKLSGIPTLLFVEGCGIFCFAAIGNLIPFRMAELGSTHSGQVGLMYLGYVVGLFVAVWIRNLVRLAGGPGRLATSASLLYALSMILVLVPSHWVLFAATWLLALGEFVVHALCPGLINRRAFGLYDSGMVNGLYLSCYYVGGVLGSFFPVFMYSYFGWTAAWLTMQTVLVLAFLALFRLYRRQPAVFSDAH